MGASRSRRDRLPPIPADKLTDAQKKAAAEFLAERKQEVFGPFVPLSRSPQLMINAAKMGTYLRFGNSLPRDVSEFAILLRRRGDGRSCTNGTCTPPTGRPRA